jgi:predicted nucleic acid-binding protein
MILLDTNLLTRITDSRNPHCAPARHATHVLAISGEKLAIVPQNLYEFWAVATRSLPVNGLGMTTKQTSQWLDFFKRRYVLLPDSADLIVRWQMLVSSLSIRGFRAHDARLVAAMQGYGISRLLTFNGPDFKDLPITVIDPRSV